MQFDEAVALIKKSEEEYINDWNKTRFLAYSIFQSQSINEINPQDVLKFPWEDEVKKIETSSKTREELIEHAKEMEEKLNKNNTN